MSETIQARRLASGPGWFVEDLVCHAGTADRPFEERHETVAIAAIFSGTFVYRSDLGRDLMTPGSVLLGSPGRCYQCGHDHGTGDRCLSFHFDPDCWDEIAGCVPGRHRGRFAVAGLAPGPALLPITARAEAALRLDPPALEEVALDLAATALRLAHERVAVGQGAITGVRAIDRQRISDAVRRIECGAGEIDDGTLAGSGALTLTALAREAGLSRYHFLRAFDQQVGMTPYQYVLHQRMRKAAVALRVCDRPIAAIALDAGFSDLSTFGRRFRRVLGRSPSAWRREGRR